ncbi:MAG: DEAD/DEAH box helicase family protein [Candidatus Cloacimonadota bacterium]|nr:DEAD/DEAH box helicase family protein [Candidatus Cloacimonadota bacterium]
MELKRYQQEVINDLIDFIEQLEQTEQLNIAFSNFWENKGISLRTLNDIYLKPYDNSIKGVPRVTVKVPTAGGKTFIACNALKPIFESFPSNKEKVVVWFVPSDTILKQTYKNLNDPSHPYRQKIDSHFGSAVKIFDKESLLFGHGFNPIEIQEQLNILVLSVQSFRSKNKESRKAYQENSNLAEFPKSYRNVSKLLPNIDDTALMQVITQLNPVVIIDESHNFESGLSLEMLNIINPSFVLDLTATPKAKSNIISFVDSMKLKKNNMVKLPVIVYNHHDSNEVISNSIQLQRTLEAKAKVEEEQGGKYIRPIVLFQAQPKTNDDNVTFEKIKQHLIDFGIDEKQIKIKTANKNEIKDIDLMSKDCEVRYIITVNALKEGWDCPFAYILASLANRTSSVDVEQILGRVLRLPYVSKNTQELLNYSYVFTSSKKFLETLDNIILSLNKAGFSAKDFRANEDQKKADTESEIQGTFEELFSNSNTDDSESDEIDTNIEINTDKIKESLNSEESKQQLNEVISLAQSTSEEFGKKMEEYEKDDNLIPSELRGKVKTYPIKENFKDDVNNLKLPTFFKKVSEDSLFETKDTFIPLTKNLLLNDFDLSKEDHNIDFSQTSSEMASIDLVEGRKNEYTPKYRKEIGRIKEAFEKHFSHLTPKGKIVQIAGKLTNLLKRIDEIPQRDISEFIRKSISNLSNDKISEIYHNEFFFVSLIKNKIRMLTDQYAEKQFITLLDKGSIICKESFEFPKTISPKTTLNGITKNLYVEEGEINDFEKKIIYEIANLESVVFWHRNLERGKGFLLNGFINHYPDFIVKMKNGKIIVIETKGDHLDGSDSLKKLRLGEKWASKAGDKFRYFMVFNNSKLDGAKSIPELLEILKDMK